MSTFKKENKEQKMTKWNNVTFSIILNLKSIFCLIFKAIYMVHDVDVLLISPIL